MGLLQKLSCESAIKDFKKCHYLTEKSIRVCRPILPQAILARVAGDALTKECPGHPATEKFNSEPPRILWERSSALCKRWHAPTSVIDQGDAWAPNFLVRKVGVETEALLLDFQVARVASPVLDLSFLIYCCGDERLVDGHFDEMLKTYHSALSTAIKALGSDPEKLYPWFLFQEEVTLLPS